MRKLAFVLVFTAAVAMAQAPAESAAPQQPPTAQPAATNLIEANTTQPSYSDVNCAGFITDQQFGRDKFVAAGWDTPHEMNYSQREFIYLAGGGYQEGALYQIIRPVKDVDPAEQFQGQRALLLEAGQMYAELGRVRVTSVRQTAIAKVEFACDAIYPGDLVVPFQEKTIPTFRAASMQFDQFAPANGKPTGRLIQSRDFAHLVATGSKVYLNVGADKGVKVGDYFRIVRPYEDMKRATTDALSLSNVTPDPYQKNAPKFPYRNFNQLPRRAIGELMILNVSPKTATGMVTYALQDIKLGDGVEMEEAPPPPPPAPPAAAAMPPTINCTANPATVTAGQSSTISCEASSADNHPVSVSFSADRGRLTPRGNSAVLDTAEAGEGPVNVMATATDDRNLSSNATATVTVQPAPAAPQASKLTDIAFRPSSAYVDNRAKAVLDDIALRLQNEPGSTVVILGTGDANEKGARRLPGLRANNGARYLVKSKGIDPARVQVQTSTAGGPRAEIWWVPQGAQMPQQPPQQ